MSIQFLGNDLKIAWDVQPPSNWVTTTGANWSDPYLKDYQVRFCNVAGSVTYGTFYTTDRKFTLTKEQNHELNSGTPIRDFSIGIAMRDKYNTVYSELLQEFTNPAPVAPTVTLGTPANGITIVVSLCQDTDYSRTKVWVSTSNGFNPVSTTPTFEAPQHVFTFAAVAGTTYYVRAAHYDDYSSATADLNVSIQYTVTVNALGTASIAASSITSTLLASTAVQLGLNIVQSNGSTSVTDLTAITSLGTSAAIAGQGALATQSSILASQAQQNTLLNWIWDPDYQDVGFWVFAHGTGEINPTYDGSTNITTTLKAVKGLKFTAQGATGAATTTAYTRGGLGSMIKAVAGYSYEVGISTLLKVGFKGICVTQIDWYGSDGTTLISSTGQAGTDHRASAVAGSDVQELVSWGPFQLPTNAVYGRFMSGVGWPAAAASAGICYHAHPFLLAINALGTSLVQSDGVTLVTDNAAITSLGTAAAFTGQGALATQSSLTPSQLFPTAYNLVNDPYFTDTGVSWTTFGATVTYDTGSDVTTVMGLPKALKIVATAANPQATSGTGMSNGNGCIALASVPYTFAIQALHKVGFKGQTYLKASWYKQDGVTLISTTTVTSGTDYRSVARASTDENVTLLGTITAPALSAYATVSMGVNWPGAAASAGTCYLGNLHVYQTTALGTNIVQSNGTTLVTDSTAITSLGTAASITGQGPYATVATPYAAGWVIYDSSVPGTYSVLTPPIALNVSIEAWGAGGRGGPGASSGGKGSGSVTYGDGGAGGEYVKKNSQAVNGSTLTGVVGDPNSRTAANRDTTFSLASTLVFNAGGGGDATDLVAASGTFTFSAHATATDTVTINGTILTAHASTQDTTHWAIGADATASATNLATCINANPTTSGIVNAGSGNNVTTVVALTGGTGGNAYTLAESSSQITKSGTTMTGGTALAEGAHRTGSTTTGSVDTRTNGTDGGATNFWDGGGAGNGGGNVTTVGTPGSAPGGGSPGGAGYGVYNGQLGRVLIKVV